MKKLLYLIVFSTFISCSSDKENVMKVDFTNHNSHIFKPFDLVEISLDSTTMMFNKSLQFSDKLLSPTLIILNKALNTLQYYNLDTKKLYKKVKIESEGENGVGIVASFYCHTQDSIFVFTRGDYKVALINDKGVIKNKYYVGRNSKGYSGLPIGEYNHDIVLEDNNLYTVVAPDLNPAQNSFIDKSLLFSKTNLKDNKTQYFVNYPSIYQKNSYPLQFLTPCETYKTNHEVVFSFPSDNFIQKYNLKDLAQPTALPCKSEYMSEVKPLDKKNYLNPELNFEHYVNNSSYERVIWDSFRKVYYRFVQHFDEKKKKMNQAPIRFSIIVINELGVKLCEYDLPDNIQNGFSFVNSKGLYVETIAESDDKIKFIGLKLIEK